MLSNKYDQYFHYLGENVVIPFYEKRLEKLKKLSLKDILQRKNPYLFKAKNIMTAAEFVESLLMAYLSSQEETIFGDLLEKFALYVSYTKYQGKKSNLKSVDLEFEKENVYYYCRNKIWPKLG